MLVVDSGKRFTMEQVRRHRWMVMADQDATASASCDSAEEIGPRDEEINEQILRLMQSLGIDASKTLESLRDRKFDHFTAIYYLLLERRSHLSSSECGRTPSTTTMDRRVASARSRWTERSPMRDSACGDSVDSERPTSPAAAPSIDEGVGAESSQWDPSPLGSCVSAFAVNDPIEDLQLAARAANPTATLRSSTSLGLPDFHQGRRASDGVVGNAATDPDPGHVCNGTAAPASSCCAGGSAEAGGSSGGSGRARADVTPLAITRREHRALCQQYKPCRVAQDRQDLYDRHTRLRPVLRQVSYKLAQQKPVLPPTDENACLCQPQRVCLPIAEDGVTGDKSLTVAADSVTVKGWYQLPGTLAVCSINRNECVTTGNQV